jgi:RNA polymerase sigma-70 factor, ECF subfamily
MNDLPPKETDRPELEPPSMTALTLNAVLSEGFDSAVDAASAAVRMTARNEMGGAAAAAVPVGEMDDHALLEATRTGDQLAFEELVRRYRNPITNFVYRMLNDYDRAVDLAQETFIRVWTSAERYQATYSFSTYIYRIASNLAISDLRQRKRRNLIPIPSFFSDKDGEEMEIELPDTRQVRADDGMVADERRKAVSTAIASLPEKYRAAVVLRDIEGRSYEEISEVLGLSDGTVKSRINRARNLLKEKLKDLL